MQDSEGRWLLLIHQIPPKPDYFRVKIWRRLQRLGAVAIKNSVYVLPKNEQTQEDFQWVLREIVEGGGEATLCEARFVDGLSDGEVEALFQTARSADYDEIALEARRLAATSVPKSKIKDDRSAQIETDLAKLKRRLAEIVAIDFFGARGREVVDGLISGIETRIHENRGTRPVKSATSLVSELKDKTWVTRKGIYVDRIASAWFVRRFVDPGARFKFVPAKGYKTLPGEIRFDMFEAEFTHGEEHGFGIGRAEPRWIIGIGNQRLDLAPQSIPAPDESVVHARALGALVVVRHCEAGLAGGCLWSKSEERKPQRTGDRDG